MTRRWRRLLAWTLAAVALPVVVVAAAHLGAAGWLRWERRAWNRDDPAGAAALARWHPADGDATARRLIELARPLGIELGSFRSSETDLRAVVAFVDGERRAVADDDADAPAAVREHLLRAEARLDPIERLLAASGPPSWPFGPRASEGTDAPILGLRDLNALLLVRAVERGRAGDRDGAAGALLASVRLGDGLRQRPEALAQLGATWVTSARAGILRRLAAPPDGWAGRLGTHDFRGSMLVSFQLEARLQLNYSRRQSFAWLGLGGPDTSARGIPRTVDRLLTTPYARGCAADTSRRLRGLAARLRAPEPCRVDEAALTPAPEELRWNRLARITLPGAPVRWRHVVEVELEEELTRIVLETRADPPGHADRVASRVCSGLAWTRTPDAEGGVTIDATGVALPKRTQDAPWRYRVAAPPVAQLRSGR
jgi:hypothetical protein